LERYRLDVAKLSGTTMERNRIDVVACGAMVIKREPAGAARLQEEVTAALTRAFFREWARVGFGRLSVESVAMRAGVGKAAVYRRWRSKVSMASELLQQVGTGMAPAPDTGSLDGDIGAFLDAACRLLTRRLVRRILPDLHAEMGRSAPLARAIRKNLQRDRRALGEALLRRAIVRGELSATLDLELALDLVAALLYWRLIVTGGTASASYRADLKKLTLAALKQLGTAGHEGAEGSQPGLAARYGESESM
jgi:AcrR family transcriptional regulator